MRILISADTVGGVWDYTTTLARAVESDGHALLVAVIGEPADDQIAMLPEGVAIECRDHPLEWQPASHEELTRTGQWLTGLARAWHADVVHLNQMAYTGLVAFPAPSLVVIHSDVISWFREVLGTLPPPEWEPYVELIRNGLHAATCAAAVSRSQAAMAQEHYGRTVDHVLYNGADLPVGSPVPRGDPLILTSGRAWDPAKGHEILDRALRALRGMAPPAHLIGSIHGPSGQHFTSEVLIRHGHVPFTEVDKWMARATVYVAPSLYEPFGLAPVEAALHGCPLLLSDIPTFRELWDGAAAFFEKGSAEHLAMTLMDLLGDPAAADELASAAAHRAARLFSTERFATRYLRLYRELAGGYEEGGGTPTPSIPAL